MDPTRLYDYLTKTRRKLFDWTRTLSQEQYVREFPYGLKTLRATMLEMARAEWLYTRRIAGEPIPPRDEWPISDTKLPGFAELEKAWVAMEPRTRALLAGITDWGTEITYRYTPPSGKAIEYTGSRADMVAQLILHEVHHRAQAMSMLRQLGVPAQNLDYSVFMYKQREV